MRKIAFCLILMLSRYAAADVEALWCGHAESGAVVDEGAQLVDVEIVGETYFATDRLRSFVGHNRPSPVDWPQLLQDADAITRRYRARGFFAAKVEVCLKPSPQNRRHVFAQFDIDAGKRARIRNIEVRGNHRVATAELIGDFALRTASPTSYMSGANYFDGRRLDDDSKKLLAEYHRRGFLDAQVSKALIKVSADLSEIDLIFEVDEGGIYNLADLNFVGDLPDGESSASWREQVSLRRGDVLNLLQLQQEVDVLLNPLRESGYALARVEPHVAIESEPNEKGHGSISVTYRILKGATFHVRRVLIEGNEATQERVIKRELPPLENTIYRLGALKTAHERLMALGYFSSVDILMVKSERDDEIDVLVRVVEQPTWLFSILPMGTANEGLIIAGFLAYRNIFGTGLAASLSVQLSSLRQLFDLALLEPRLFDSIHSLVGEAHHRQLQYRMFRTKSLGGGLRWSMPVADYFKISGGLRIDRIGVDGISSADALAKVVTIPNDSLLNGIELSTQFDWSGALGNKARAGVHVDLFGTYWGPLNWSSTGFFDIGATAKFFVSPIPLIKLKSRTQVGVLVPISERPLSLAIRYFLGGQGSVRGYVPRSIGPSLQLSDGSLFQIGGTSKFLQSFEFEFPVWPRHSLSGYIFVDAGNTFLNNASWIDAGLYWSTGFGLQMPILHLPLRVELGIPLSPSAALVPFDLFIGFNSEF